jgi:hypothetical protein
MINARKIKGKMVELGLTQKDIAAKEVWKCALPTVSQKINGVRPMFVSEAEKLGKLLNLTEQEYYDYFFGG